MFAKLETVKETALALFESTDEHAGIALQLALDILEKNMPEAEFLKFCEQF